MTPSMLWNHLSQTNTLPVPVPRSPVDRQSVQSGELVVVEFFEVEEAETYKVQFFDKEQRLWIYGPDETAVCADGVCSLSLGEFGAGTSAAWRAQAFFNVEGVEELAKGKWSASSYFKAVDLKAAASRFVQMADFDVTDEDIDKIVQDGPEAWLDSQLDLVNSDLSRYEWMEQTTDTHLHYLAFNRSTWNRLFNARSGVLERWVLALSEIFVINVKQTDTGGLRGFGGAAYLDMLEAGSLGSYRELLEDITLSHQMGSYLSLLGQPKGG